MLYDDVYNGLESDFKKGKLNNRVSIIVYLVLFFLLLLFIIGIMLKRRPYSFVADFNYLPEPVQQPVSGHVEFKMWGLDLAIDFLADYEVNGRVIMINNFDGFSNYADKLSPKNYILGWSELGILDNIEKFEWNSNIGDILVSPTLKPGNDERFASFGGHDYLNLNYSNNRLISSDKKTKVLLDKIKEGDVVRIKGYLANVSLVDGSWKRGPSCGSVISQSCDVIYVTDVSWLKEM